MSNESIMDGFRSIRLFSTGSATEEIRASRERQAQAIQRLRTLSPGSTNSSPSRGSKR